ncbi:MAG: sn-glycerol-3-phosphate ABC transporter ATP-binding protein UgpC [Hyphomicrobiaceae bacterium]|nr:sn-glycerol-3-phosphate ABC transporter ATP-binding protein UgpC [Hyphomicrobiaceae bacterium]MCC0023184.1 sn-glycerol-3-phosphate ABC transporter ATP-binding protein UgpC [Hyphomicrobiaceae bacterium]
MASIHLKNVGKRYPDGNRAVIDLNLDIADGDFMVLVGPSGCGKTTALRMVAGLEEISEGEIHLGGELINDVEPGKRDIAMVFQNYALYPHMSVFENIAFPLLSQGVPRAERRDRVERTAAVLGISDMLDRKPRTLSGGQRQRVAMGRAIVREPQAFLMDEPLSNLDAKLRVQMRSEISRIQAELGITTIYVTHDQVEAMTMGTRIAVMRKGVLQQEGSPEVIYGQPANLFVAAFIGSPGMNFVTAELSRRGDDLVLGIGPQELVLPPKTLAQRPALLEHESGSIVIGIRPEHLSLPPTDNSAKLKATVERSEMLGAERLLHVSISAKPVSADEIMEAAEEVSAAAPAMLQDGSKGDEVALIARIDPSIVPQPGSTVELGVGLDRLHFFDLESGRAVL